MLATTPTSEYVRKTRRDLSTRTPPRFSMNSSFRPTLLTPSPLKRHAAPVDEDDLFSSPLPSATANRRENMGRRRTFDDDDEEDDGLFTVPHSHSLFPPSSSPMPLRTPIKSAGRVTSPERQVLSVKHMNSPQTAGVKRKPTPAATTPIRKRGLTPLNITSSAAALAGDSTFGFDRLAPLPAPRFNLSTPQNRTDTELTLKRQADSMTRLRINDRDHESGDESGYDSGPDFPEVGKALFPTSAVKGRVKQKLPPLQSPRVQLLAREGQAKEGEVVEAMSPGGHITKRRARSRPVSAELLSSVQTTPEEQQAKSNMQSPKSPQSSVVFPPPRSAFRGRNLSYSSTSSSDFGSPPTRPMPRIQTDSLQPPRGPMNRLDSVSSATLFFGPAIPQPNKPVEEPMNVDQPQTGNKRQSLGGHGPSNLGFGSPRRGQLQCDSDEEADFFFSSSGPKDSSFTFSLTGGTPSPMKKQRTESIELLPKKFRPRDSGVVLDESDDSYDGLPRASTSVSTINSGSDGEALVTPGFAPTAGSGWPTVGVYNLDDEDYHGRFNTGERGVDAFIMRTLTAGATSSKEETAKRPPGTPVKRIKTSHIMDRPWQSAVASKIGFPDFDDPRTGKGKKGAKPRKSLPAAFPVSARPARTERQRRDALNFGVSRASVSSMEVDAEGDDEEASPSMRRDARYEGLGLGRPTARPGADVKGWLMRRSSSGAFSSGSDCTSSTTATPTRLSYANWTSKLPTLSQGSTTTSTTESPTSAAVSRHMPPPPAPHTISNASPKKSIFAAPTQASSRLNKPFAGLLRTRRSLAFGEEQLGRFERDFVEIDELGRGEFGRVMKARYKQGSQEVFAVKKSKRFEGVKHRLRLREEVELLKHLSQVAGAQGYGTQVQTRSQAHPAALGRHPNVLGYIDSWEEDETLFIQTELCELGNFAHFLWEYGKSFPKLDEERVWKILADLSDGLSFIHDAGVIHLDLKPANIFISGDGRFKIGDFGMASIWPRPPTPGPVGGNGAPLPPVPGQSESFEREGDKLYLSPEVLQGKYGKAADIFSLGMTMLETATNIVVPDQGESWHRLRHDDFAQVDFMGVSDELTELIKHMMQSDPALRIEAGLVVAHPIIVKARAHMEALRAERGPVFGASPLSSVGEGWLEEIMDMDEDDMDIGF
ncbi:hypothetical protein QCA50_004619 [Cerrena zonata]|uniref:Protein kinase domain-containing protein n=1 Tax=Cerrena zonata TaxID=2478898 RepID=A0AAW0GI32_9APHY